MAALAAWADRTYGFSPVWAQQAMVAAYGYWWRTRRFGGDFRSLVAEFQERDRWCADRFAAYQRQRLNEVLDAACQSPYYRRVFERAGLRRGRDPLDELARLPLLTKDTLRSKGRELLTQSTLPAGTISFKSSGTTGTPTEIFYTRRFHALELAVPQARNLGWAGVGPNARRVMFGVRKVCRFSQAAPPFWRFSPSENMAYASIYHLSPEFLPHYMTFLRRYRPEIIMGYPSALNTLASYALDENDLPLPVQAVFPTSETVTTEIRARVETAFQAKIYDRYCAVEMCVFASECESGRYHVSPDVGIVELVDSDSSPVPPGVPGEVICTGLHNTLQPLIRYRLGDVAQWAVDQHCECGRSMPILESVEGRHEDICYTADGREVLRFDTVFKNVSAIREAQVVQESLGTFVIRVVPTAGFTDRAVETISKNMRAHVGDVSVVVTPVAAISRTASGKFRAVVCSLTDDERRLVSSTRRHPASAGIAVSD